MYGAINSYFIPIYILKYLTEKYHPWPAKHWTHEEIGCVMFGALLYMAHRPGHQENWSGSIWRALNCAGGECRR